MTRQERRNLYCYNPKTDEPMCSNCKHFIRHYMKGGPPVYTIPWCPLDRGHCTCARAKDRTAYDLCEKWERREE